MIPDHLRDRFDPVYAGWLEKSHPPAPTNHQPSIEQMREGFRRQVALSNGALDERLSVRDIELPGRDGHGIPVRIYRHKTAQGAQACCLFLHGGGWVLGDLDTHSGVCNDIAIETGLTVIALDYRLSPEHIFPAALNDTVDALTTLTENAPSYGILPDRILVSADSAGASLALSAALTLRRTPALPRAMALVYPGIGADMERPSFVENREVPGLTPELMRFFLTRYIGGETLPDPLAAPLTVENLSGLPPLFVSVAELDPLRDDGTDLVLRLERESMPVTSRIEPGLGHGFLWVRRLSTPAAAAFQALCEFLREHGGNAERSSAQASVSTGSG